MSDSRSNYLAELSRSILPLRIARIDSPAEFVTVIHCEYEVGTRLLCRRCGGEASYRGHVKERIIRHLDLDLHQAFLRFSMPRTKCNTDGIHVARQSFFHWKSRFSIAFEDAVLSTILKRSSIHELVDEFGLSRQSIYRIIERAKAIERKSRYPPA